VSIRRIAPFIIASTLVACGEEESTAPVAEDSGSAVDSSTDTNVVVEDSGAPLDTSTPTDTPAEVSTPKGTADIQLLTISDWHGQVEAFAEEDRTTGITTKWSGIAALSGYFKEARAANPLTLTLTAGDAFGATTLLSTYGSATLPDEPAVKGLNFLKIDADTFGNHNFDRGITHLKSLMDLGTYKYVSTNLTNVTTELGTKVATPYHLIDVGTGDKLVRVALLGVTNPDAATLVFPGRMGTIVVKEPVAAANAAAADARKAGANVVVALTHMGATAKDMAGNPTGPAIDFAKALVGVDVVAADHVDISVNQKIGSTYIVQNRSKGRTFAKIDVKVETGVVKTVSASVVDAIAGYSFNHGTLTETKTCTVTGDCSSGYTCASGKCTRNKTCPTEVMCPATFTCTSGKCEKATPVTLDEPAASTLLKPYNDALASKYDEKLAKTTDVFKRDGSLERSQETPLGDLVAESLLMKYKADGAQIAFVNGGGLRNSIPGYTAKDTTLVRTGCSSTTPCDVVLGDPVAVLNLGNKAVLRSITGKALWEALEFSVAKLPAIDGRFLQIAGFKFEAKVSNTVGMRIVKVTLDDGTAIPNDATKTYKMVTGDFTSKGGDGYTMLVEPAPSPELDLMSDIFIDYIKGKTLNPASYSGRITLTP
jgi:5'-nucleotidase